MSIDFQDAEVRILGATAGDRDVMNLQPWRNRFDVMDREYAIDNLRWLHRARVARGS